MSNTSEKISNDDRKRDKLLREATRAHEWRVQVWAQMENKIRAANATLTALGGEAYEPWNADFDDAEALAHYSTMTLTK